MTWSVGGRSTASPWDSLVGTFWVQISGHRVLQRHHLPTFSMFCLETLQSSAHCVEGPAHPASDPSHYHKKLHHLSLVFSTAIKELVEKDLAVKSTGGG